MSTSHGRLVVVSNRLPLILGSSGGSTTIERAPGGVVSALDIALRRRGGTWIGWPGAPLRDRASLDEFGRSAGYRLIPVPLSQTELRQYYLGFSNGTMWPLLHSFPGRIELDRDDWETYESVNRRFAEITASTMGDDDLVWIHDYQLMRVALHTRQLRPEARIGFFLHVPFPPLDLFRILPWDRAVLQGMLACDLVAFHCARYVTNFLDCVEHLLGARVDRVAGKVEYGDRTVCVATLPLGIDFEWFHERASGADAPAGKPHRIVLGVDRLDYTKGLPEKLRAFERLLEIHPEYRETVVLYQLAELSRDQLSEYRRLKRQVDELVGRINGRFATSGWTPIRYFHRSEDPESLARMYQRADVALVTPLRDGMNLVAKEYVACQTEDPGVLILSRLAGAAEVMQEALLVNPYNVDSVAEAMHTALEMTLAERTERMRALQQRVRRADVHDWAERFLERASAPITPIRPLCRDDFSAWLGRAAEGQRLAVFLDFDGTLAEISSHPSLAEMKPSVRAKLAACCVRTDTDLSIVTGRSLEDISRMGFPHPITLIANHGLEIESPRIPRFRHPEISRWRPVLKDAGDLLEARLPDGCWCEDKGASVTVHFRSASPADQLACAAETRRLAHELGLRPRPAHCAVEMRMPVDWDKGDAVLHVLRAIHGGAWSESVEAIYAGDDETDEDAFRALQGLGVTFRVGHAGQPTAASHRLRDVDAVESLLDWIAQR